MLIIGLTGGIGSGKSTVTKHFSALDVPIIDADILSHKLVASGQPALQEIINIFGAEILISTGELDRNKLRQRVFSNSTERSKLENILHPRIRAEIQLQLNQFLTALYVILAVPLLFEAGFNDLCHRILVIDVSKEIQIQRVQKRNGFSIAEITAIMNNQWQREQRIAAANEIINNDGNLIQLKNQIDKLHQFYLSYTNSY